MLFLRFLIQNNETSSYINLSRAIDLCPQIPPQFHSFDNYIQAIIVRLNTKNNMKGLKEEGEKYYIRKRQHEAIHAFSQALQLIQITESIYPELHLSHLKSLLLYFCADMNYYANNYKKTICREWTDIMT